MTKSTVEPSRRQRERLETEHIIWLTTVNEAGNPVPTPVWFLWSEGEFLLLSEPATPKLANIARAGVSVNFNSNSSGGDVAVFSGRAQEDPNGPSAAQWDAYVVKYGDAMIGMDYTPEKFRAEYSTLVRIVPTRLRGW